MFFEQWKFRIDYLRGHLPENLAYGHQAVIQRYCGARIKIFGRLQHGFDFGFNPGMAGAGMSDNTYPNFYWDYRTAAQAQFEDKKGQHFFTGSPYIYLTDPSPNKTSIKFPKKSSLVVLPHSAFGMNRAT